MNTNGKNIVEQLAVLLSLQNKTKEELEAILQRYPYFALARFLFSKKIKEKQDPDAETQMQKTVLYFHNPLWFEYLTTANQADSVIYSTESLSSFEQQTNKFSDTDNLSETNIVPNEIEEST